MPEGFPAGGQPLDDEPDRRHADPGDKTRLVDAPLAQRVFIGEHFDVRHERVAQCRAVHVGTSGDNAVLDQVNGKFYIIAQAWNPGDFAILEQVAN